MIEPLDRISQWNVSSSSHENYASSEISTPNKRNSIPSPFFSSPQPSKVNSNKEVDENEFTPSRLKFAKEESPRKRQRPTFQNNINNSKTKAKSPAPMIGSSSSQRSIPPVHPTKTPTKKKSNSSPQMKQRASHTSPIPPPPLMKQNSRSYNDAIEEEGRKNSDQDMLNTLLGALKAMMVKDDETPSLTPNDNTTSKLSSPSTTSSTRASVPSSIDEKWARESAEGDRIEREAIAVLESNKQLAKSFPTAMRVLMSPTPSSASPPPMSYRDPMREVTEKKPTSPLSPQETTPRHGVIMKTKAEQNAAKLKERVQGIKSANNDYSALSSNQPQLHREYLDLIGGLRSSSSPSSQDNQSSSREENEQFLQTTHSKQSRSEGFVVNHGQDEDHHENPSSEWSCYFCFNVNKRGSPDCLLCGKNQSSKFDS